MSVFLHNDCPADTTFVQHLKRQLPWDEAVKSVSWNGGDLRVSGAVNHAELLSEVNRLYDSVGAVHWQSQQPGALYGMSLSYNPAHPRAEWSKGSFGHRRYQQYTAKDYFQRPAMDASSAPRDDYLDSYGFRLTLPQVFGCYGMTKFLESFALPVIRVTARTIDGSKVLWSPTPTGGMHVDDSVFEVLRVNVCLSTSEHYGFQYLGEEPFFRQPGETYVIDSDRMHRVYVSGPNKFQRTHLIVGLAPWLDYDQATDSWSPNKYFGNVHPLQIAQDGALFRGNL